MNDEKKGKSEMGKGTENNTKERKRIKNIEKEIEKTKRKHVLGLYFLVSTRLHFKVAQGSSQDFEWFLTIAHSLALIFILL